MTKITAYTAITGANLAATDLTEVVDVSDTSMAASGTNKSIQVDEIRKYLMNPALLNAIATPSVPPADSLKVYAYKRANHTMLRTMGPAGLDMFVQPHVAHNSVLSIKGGFGVAAPAGIGPVPTAVGTATAATFATATGHTAVNRVDYLVTTAATSAIAGWRYATATMMRGGTPTGFGGFYYVCRWGPATGVATTTNRAFVGLANAVTAPSDVEPSSQSNIIGMGWDAADANIQIMVNAASTTTKTNLGASFPVPTADRTKMYELALFNAPGDTNCYYEVTDISTSTPTIATGTLSTNLPALTTALAPRGWMSAGGTSSVIGIALSSLYIESDF